MPTMGNPTGKHRRKRRHHGEGTVVLRKDRWRAKPWAAVVPYTDASGRRREMWLSAASKAEAERLRDAEVKKLAKGIVRTEQTVGEYVNAWLETVEVGPGTWPRYRAHVTERIEPAFGDVALRLLTPQMVRSALIRWKGAPQTRGGTLRLLRAAMKQAVADRRIEHDPTAGIPYPRVARKDPVTLDSEQARRLIATVKGERFAPILIVSLGLGVRRGEALGLRTQDVHLEDYRDEAALSGPGDWAGGHRALGATTLEGAATGEGYGGPQGGVRGRARPAADASGEAARTGTVTIAKGLRYIPPTLRAPGEGPYRLTGTKTGETREVPLPAFVAEALRERLAERDIEQRAAKVWAANDFVFCSPVGNSVPLQTLYAWFKGALKRAGLPDMRWHELRASTITLLLDMGVDLLTIQRIVGHKDLATTRRYVGKTPAAMTGAADRLEEAMG
jgi:integrase